MFMLNVCDTDILFQVMIISVSIVTCPFIKIIGNLLHLRL